MVQSLIAFPTLMNVALLQGWPTHCPRGFFDLKAFIKCPSHLLRILFLMENLFFVGKIKCGRQVRFIVE